MNLALFVFQVNNDLELNSQHFIKINFKNIKGFKMVMVLHLEIVLINVKKLVILFKIRSTTLSKCIKFPLTKQILQKISSRLLV
jgi:hypothetical protein